MKWQWNPAKWVNFIENIIGKHVSDWQINHVILYAVYLSGCEMNLSVIDYRSRYRTFTSSTHHVVYHLDLDGDLLSTNTYHSH